MPLFEDAVHAALALDGPPVTVSVIPRATSAGYVFDKSGEEAVWWQARRFLILSAETSAALYGALLKRRQDEGGNNEASIYDQVSDQTVLVRHGSVGAAYLSLRALPVACTTVIRAAYAYLRSVGVLYDHETGAMCVLPAAAWPRPFWTGPYAWSDPKLRRRTTRALAAAELATVLLDSGLPSPWRAWSLLCATYLVRAWLERLAYSGSYQHPSVCVPPFPRGLLDIRKIEIVDIIVSLWAATEWLSCGLAWARNGLNDEEAPWKASAPVNSTTTYLSCPLCGGIAEEERRAEGGSLMAHGASLAAWRALWTEARVAAEKTPPTPLAAYTWKKALSEFDKAMGMWTNHCLSPGCVRTSATQRGLYLKQGRAEALREQTLVQEMKSSL